MFLLPAFNFLRGFDLRNPHQPESLLFVKWEKSEDKPRQAEAQWFFSSLNMGTMIETTGIGFREPLQSFRFRLPILWVVFAT